MKLAIPLVISALSMVFSMADASTGNAWEEHDQDVIEKCKGSSQFPDAAAIGGPMLFSDDVGITALLIEGSYPQDHMEGQVGRELCLYDRATQEVHLTDADTLLTAESNPE